MRPAFVLVVDDVCVVSGGGTDSRFPFGAGLSLKAVCFFVVFCFLFVGCRK